MPPEISFRTKVLTAAGGSAPVLAWAKSKSKRSGVEVRRVDGDVELRKGNRAIRLAPKHVFFAPEVCGAFEAFTSVLPAQQRDGLNVIDFAANPDLFNLVRSCLAYGVILANHDGKMWLQKDSRVMILSSAHLVYARDMAEKFDLYFSPLVPEVREGLQVLDYSTPGNLQTYKSGLQFEMASFPEEEEAIEEYFKWYRPKVGDLVFDIGAHCGVSTYQLSKLVGEAGKVVAFEPDPVNYEILRRNIERHGLTNVIAERAAIADKVGKLGFNSEGTIGSSLQSLLLRESVGSIVMVDAITLASAFERWGTPAFCKIDIEGAEVDVLANSADVLRKHPTHFALDTNHPKANGEMTNGDVEQVFTNCGYEVISEANPLLTTWARPR
jgi:FkbM family methyltransferase